MCGFAGFAGLVDNQVRMRNHVEQMNRELEHRGPDDRGCWLDAQMGLALGFRRLAIVDLSPGGHQPMSSSNGRYVITFNGEIYNHRDLRAQVISAAGPVRFNGQSDTEVLLVAIQHWGLRKALQKCVGMFAFALWDKVDRKLHLVRDRMGEKPLYFGKHGHTLLFGSELKALRKHPDFRSCIDRQSLGEYLRFGYVPAPRTIFQGINKLMPATIATFEREHATGWNCVGQDRYWSLPESTNDASQAVSEYTDQQQQEELRRLLFATISDQMVADVPVGVFLSGGIDSSLITAVMQKLSPKPINTFSIGFDDPRFDEAQFARAVSQHLGTDHTEMYVTGKQALDVIPTLPHVFDEPFADSSQIPTLLVSALAKTKTTVCLSGDGGDELFYGYARYRAFSKLWSYASSFPLSLRRILGRVLGDVTALQKSEIGSFARKIYRATEVARAANLDDAYKRVVSVWADPSSVVLGLHPVSETEQMIAANQSVDDFIMVSDLQRYLPDNILTKVDRATMSVSLESRAPFLDHRVVEFARGLPMSMLYRQGQTKWLLRQVLYSLIPKSLVERPKQGFGIPVDLWLRGPLRDWANSLLDEELLRSQGFFDAALIRRCWEQHSSAKGNWGHPLWHILMFQAWFTSLENSQSASLNQHPLAA